MELQNKRPTQILIVSKQSRQCSGELNTNFWMKELKQSLAAEQKVKAMLELELSGSNFSTKNSAKKMVTKFYCSGADMSV